MHCKTTIDVPHDTLIAEGFTEDDIKGGFQVYEPRPKGCEKCKDGYKGAGMVIRICGVTVCSRS